MNKKYEKLRTELEDEIDQWKEEAEKLKAENGKLTDVVGKLKSNYKSLDDEYLERSEAYDKLEAEHEKYKGLLRNYMHRLKDQETMYTRDRGEWEGQLSKCNAQIGKLEEDKADYQSQLDKMSQIVSKLSKRGLPLAPDDSYFVNALDSVVSELRQWARFFVKGQPALKAGDEVWSNLTAETQTHLNEAFADLPSLLESPNVGTKVRTRCVEAILCRSLISTYLFDSLIGIDKQDMDNIHQLSKSHVNVSGKPALIPPFPFSFIVFRSIGEREN